MLKVKFGLFNFRRSDVPIGMGHGPKGNKGVPALVYRSVEVSRAGVFPLSPGSQATVSLGLLTLVYSGTAPSP